MLQWKKQEYLQIKIYTKHHLLYKFLCTYKASIILILIALKKVGSATITMHIMTLIASITMHMLTLTAT